MQKRVLGIAAAAIPTAHRGGDPRGGHFVHPGAPERFNQERRETLRSFERSQP